VIGCIFPGFAQFPFEKHEFSVNLGMEERICTTILQKIYVFKGLGVNLL
jgi:hypothetical protein